MTLSLSLFKGHIQDPASHCSNTKPNPGDSTIRYETLEPHSEKGL